MRGNGHRSLVAFALTASALSASVPSPVSASTGTCDGSGNFSVVAAAGEVNRFYLTRPLDWELTDSPPGQLTGDSTCSGEAVNIDAGDLDDDARVTPAGGRINLDGGLGNDWLRTGDPGQSQPLIEGEYHLAGGQGDDNLLGAGSFPMDAPGVIETLDGGPGNDKISGGGGNDIVLGGDGTENPGIGGGGGDDVVDLGEGGEDPLIELASGGPGDDRVYGGPGDDTVFGDTGEDMLFGGAGQDLLMAKDREAGTAPWPDVPPAEVDQLDCGPGEDHTWADSIDVIDVSCEYFGVLNDFSCEGQQCDGLLTMYASGGAAAAAGGSGGKRKLIGMGRFKARKHSIVRPESKTNKRGRKLARKRDRMRVAVTMTVMVKLRGGKTKTVRKRSVTTLSSGE